MAGDEDAERLALPREHLARRRRRDVGQFRRERRRLIVRLAEERHLAELGVARRSRRELERRIERGELLRAVSGDAVERAALDQRFEHAPVDLLGVDALRQVEEIGETPVRLARLDDAAHRRLADALDRGQAEANRARRRRRNRRAIR